MRLLTAIPLLFWASTAAMAQLAVLWAADPAISAATHASPQTAVEAGRDSESPAAAHLLPVAIGIAPDFPALTETAKPLRPESDIAPTARILAASRLLANPPPFGV